MGEGNWFSFWVFKQDLNLSKMPKLNLKTPKLNLKRPKLNLKRLKISLKMAKLLTIANFTPVIKFPCKKNAALN